MFSVLQATSWSSPAQLWPWPRRGWATWRWCTACRGRGCARGGVAGLSGRLGGKPWIFYRFSHEIRENLVKCPRKKWKNWGVQGVYVCMLLVMILCWGSMFPLHLWWFFRWGFGVINFVAEVMCQCLVQMRGIGWQGFMLRDAILTSSTNDFFI